MNLKGIRLVNLDISRNMQSFINVFANVLSFGISMIISFFISPYIVRTLGAEANGFVQLANSFISYASLFRIALNGVGSRYIIIEYNKGNIDKANLYFSSLFFGDVFLSVVFSVLSIGCVWKLENLINISDGLVTDVKILFGLIFANYIFTTATAILNVSCYVKNKIYLQSIRDIQSYLIRALVLLLTFSLFEAKVFFLGVATIVPSVIVVCYNIYYKKILTPDLKISTNHFSIKAIKELISQGIWNSIASLGSMLLSSFDLLIANLFVNEKDMGILSVAKSMPTIAASFGTTVSSVFFSAMAIDYASEDKSTLVKTVKQSTRLTGFIVTIPLGFLITYGMEFYSLWQPTLDSKQLQTLSLLSVFGLVFSAGATAVDSIFTITLHVKEKSAVTLITGTISIATTLLLVKYTNLGIYAIAGTSTLINIFPLILYTLPYAAKYIGEKKTTFIPVIFRAVTSTVCICTAGYLLKLIMPSNTWVYLVVSAFMFSVIAVLINYVVMLDKETRTILVDFVKSKLKIKK